MTRTPSALGGRGRACRAVRNRGWRARCRAGDAATGRAPGVAAMRSKPVRHAHAGVGGAGMPAGRAATPVRTTRSGIPGSRGRGCGSILGAASPGTLLTNRVHPTRHRDTGIAAPAPPRGRPDHRCRTREQDRAGAAAGVRAADWGARSFGQPRPSDLVRAYPEALSGFDGHEPGLARRHAHADRSKLQPGRTAEDPRCRRDASIADQLALPLPGGCSPAATARMTPAVPATRRFSTRCMATAGPGRSRRSLVRVVLAAEEPCGHVVSITPVNGVDRRAGRRRPRAGRIAGGS